MQICRHEDSGLEVLYLPKATDMALRAGGALIPLGSERMMGLNLDTMDDERPHGDDMLELLEEFEFDLADSPTWEKFKVLFAAGKELSRLGEPYSGIDIPMNPLEDPKAKNYKATQIFENGMTIEEARAIVNELIAQCAKSEAGFPSRWTYHGGQTLSAGNALAFLCQTHV